MILGFIPRPPNFFQKILKLVFASLVILKIWKSSEVISSRLYFLFALDNKTEMHWQTPMNWIIFPVFLWIGSAGKEAFISGYDSYLAAMAQEQN